MSITNNRARSSVKVSKQQNSTSSPGSTTKKDGWVSRRNSAKSTSRGSPPSHIRSDFQEGIFKTVLKNSSTEPPSFVAVLKENMKKTKEKRSTPLKRSPAPQKPVPMAGRMSTKKSYASALRLQNPRVNLGPQQELYNDSRSESSYSTISVGSSSTMSSLQMDPLQMDPLQMDPSLTQMKRRTTVEWNGSENGFHEGSTTTAEERMFQACTEGPPGLGPYPPVPTGCQMGSQDMHEWSQCEEMSTMSTHSMEAYTPQQNPQAYTPQQNPQPVEGTMYRNMGGQWMYPYQTILYPAATPVWINETRVTPSYILENGTCKTVLSAADYMKVHSQTPSGSVDDTSESTTESPIQHEQPAAYCLPPTLAPRMVPYFVGYYAAVPGYASSIGYSSCHGSVHGSEAGYSSYQGSLSGSDVGSELSYSGICPQ